MNLKNLHNSQKEQIAANKLLDFQVKYYEESLNYKLYKSIYDKYSSSNSDIDKQMAREQEIELIKSQKRLDVLEECFSQMKKECDEILKNKKDEEEPSKK